MKKHPILIAILSIFALSCVSGIVLSILDMLDGSKTQKTIDKNNKELKSLVDRKGALALSEENVVVAAENLNMLKKARREKIAAVVEPKLITSNFNGDSTTLVSDLKTYQQNNAERCMKSSVGVSDNASYFGFSRYLSNSSETVPVASLREIDSEAKMIGIILDNLVKANEKHEKALHDANVIPATQKVFLRVNGIRREAFELVGEKRRSLMKDEFVVFPDDSISTTGLVSWRDGLGKEGKYISLQRPGIMKTIAVQVEFVGDSAVLRELLESLKDYSLYVRDIQAIRATADMLPIKSTSEGTSGEVDSSVPADPFNFFAATDTTKTAPAAVPRAKARVVVEEGRPELFCVTFEYLTPIASKEAEKPETK